MDNIPVIGRTRWSLCLFVFSFCFCSACHKPAPPPLSQPGTPTEQERRTEQAAELPPSLQKHWTFLNRLRQSDRYSDIDRTLVNEQGELGVVLSSSIESGQIEPLLQKVMKEMAREFPGEDIALNAYEPTKPLRKLGRARLDGKTEEVTYLGAR